MMVKIHLRFVAYCPLKVRPTDRKITVTANVFPSQLIPFTLMMEAMYSFEASVLKRATRRNIQEDGIHHSHRRENHKSYLALTG
jgi:hypothetical protein